LRTGFQPLLEHLLRPSGHHVEQTCWACCLADRGEVDDDGDVLVATPSVPPYVLVDTDDADPVEMRRVVDQQPVTFSEDGGWRDGEVCSGVGDYEAWSVGGSMVRGRAGRRRYRERSRGHHTFGTSHR